MGRLLVTEIVSLDGYVNDAAGRFDWAEPDAEVHQHVNDLERDVGTFLLGRRMHEVMAFWDDVPGLDDEPAAIQDFARLWQAADKVVYSTTLPGVGAPRTRLERTFDVDAVRALLDAAERDVSVGGPTLAAHALRAGLVDEVRLYVNPVVVGSGGIPWLPGDVAMGLDLVDEQRFGNGVVHLRYLVRR